MTAPITCRICSGPLVSHVPGRGRPAGAAVFAPTNHGIGQHEGFHRCLECGAVQQPSLRPLPDTYRNVNDEAYATEEEGRRRTARRILDAVAPHAPNGRLLDVGCGHGFLVQEARARGYEPVGVEPSESAAAYGREVLGLDVVLGTLDELDSVTRFRVVVLSDVLEHLDDPRSALERCGELLEPGGILAVLTPDPHAAVARLFRGRWWSYIPAHTVLLPRRTLRELLGGAGLVVSADAPIARSFTLGYWLEGLAQRLGALGGPLRLVTRAMPRGAIVSLRLGDDRLMLAHRLEPAAPPVAIASDRGGAAKVHVVLPAYNASSTLAAVADELPRGVADRALVVDDASTDGTTVVALSAGFEVIRHARNRGYGANQKTSYARALLDGADIVVMVHADNQYDPALVPEMVAPILEGTADAVIGSRLLEDRAVAGGMPRWKWLGNRFLTGIENRAFGQVFSEYHTGYRAFSADLLRSIPFLRNSDSFVFDQEIFAQMIARRARIREIPIPTRYFLEASSVSFAASVRYGLTTLWVLLRFRADRRRPWGLLREPAVCLRPRAESQHAGLQPAAVSSSAAD